MRTTPRAVVYLRVSTYMQERDGVSLDAQLDMARRFCEMRGFELTDTYVDTMSGTSDARPGLAKLEADLKRRAFDHVLVYKVDRLSRDAAHYHRLLQEFERHDVGLGSLTQDIDATTSMGRLILRILIALAEHESEQTGDRVRDSIRYRAQQGRIIAGHQSPLGYRYVKAFTDTAGVRQPGRYEVDEREAATVRWLYATFLEKRTVLATLEAAQAAGHTGRDGAPLTRAWVRGVLANPIYKGELVGCKRRTVKSGGRKVTVKVKQDAWVRREGLVPPLVDATNWEATQDLLALNAAKPARAIYGELRYAWSGLVKCASCGKTMGHNTSQPSGRPRPDGSRPGRIAQYGCARRGEKGANACQHPAQVSEAFLDLFVAPAVFASVREAIDAGRSGRKPAAKPKGRERDLAGEMQKLETRRRRLRDLYELGDQMTIDEYKEKVAEINRRVAELQAAQGEAARAPAPPPAIPGDLSESWVRLADRPGDRRRILGTLVARVEVERDAKVARIVFRPYDHPAWPDTLEVPIISMSSKEGRRARGLPENWSPRYPDGKPPGDRYPCGRKRRASTRA